MGKFRPRNKTVYVVFDEESDFLGPRTLKNSLDQAKKKEKRKLQKN